jgi:hypothetical protein
MKLSQFIKKSVYIFQQLFEGLECGHEFCTRCWKEYLTSKIMDEQKEVRNDKK